MSDMVPTAGASLFAFRFASRARVSACVRRAYHCVLVFDQLLHDLLSLEAGDQWSTDAHDGNNGCCRGENQLGCACTGGEAVSTERVSSSPSVIGPRGPGLAKDEYQRLKKAGLLPPKLRPAAGKHAIKNGKETTAGGQALPGGQRPAHGRLGGMVVVYASQTGNAHNVAKDLYEDASEKGFAAELKDMAELDSYYFFTF